MTIKLSSSLELVFSKSSGEEIKITKFDPKRNPEATTARATEILHLYGGYGRYQPISSTTQFSDDNTYCLARNKDSKGLPSPPLQEFPVDSPLDLVKQELAKDDKIIQPVAFF